MDQRSTSETFAQSLKWTSHHVLQAVYWKVYILLNMNDMQLNRLMKERYLISLKPISEQSKILFSYKNFPFATNDYSTSEEFSKLIDDKYPSHFYYVYPRYLITLMSWLLLY